MHITELAVENIRILKQLTIHPAEGLNIFSGKNASGKTSILEAIAILATTRSFRTDKISQVITYNKNNLLVRSRIKTKDKKTNILGVTRNQNKDTKVSINFSSGYRKDLVKQIAIQVINPKLSDLVFAGAKVRREFMDWGVFHVEQAKREIFQQFKKSLKQRNSILRTNNLDNSQIKPWSKIFAKNAEGLNEIRKQQLTKLVKIYNDEYADLLDFKKIELKFYQGWPEQHDLLYTLNKNIKRDMDKGITGAGPQLADIKILIDGKSAKDQLSRGEAKILSFLIRLSQIRLYIESQNTRPILLLDDISAELDKSNRSIVISCLRDLRIQAFITTTGKKQISLKKQDKLFHVKQGLIKEIAT